MNDSHNPSAAAAAAAALVLHSPPPASYSPSASMDYCTSSSHSTSPAVPPCSFSSSQAAVARDLLRAAQDENLCDVALVSSSSSSDSPCGDDSSKSSGSHCASAEAVPANRFVLAARSAVFRRMLYGRWRESRARLIRLPMQPAVLRAVVHFCHGGGLLWGEATSLDDADGAARLVQLARAADYLELPRLRELAEDRALRWLATDPAAVACIVLQEAWDGSRLEAAALQMVECRPYAALPGRDGGGDGDDNNTGASGGGVRVLSAEKFELVLQNAAVGAGEWFLFGLLLRWYHHQLQQVNDDNSNTNTQRAKGERDEIVRAAQRLARHLRLSYIEPERLLSPVVQACPWISRERVFEAVAGQALRASQDQVWRLQCRGGRGSSDGGGGADRILVEGAGHRAANGLYHRIAPGLANRSDLYSKREVSCGQQHVYTLSRCLIRPPAAGQQQQQQQQQEEQDNNSNSDTNNPQQHAQEYYEFRIFCSKFLTHRAVQSLVQMQSTATLVPYFQPVLQVLNLQPPADSDDSDSGHWVPTPIRKFHRLRLSDGDHHMPATLSDSFRGMMEQREIRDRYVLQVLEFGVYAVHGTVGVHVIRAAVVTSTPAYVFGSPVPLEEAVGGGEPMSVDGNHGSSSSSSDEAALRNLYRCRCPVDEQLERTSSRIPRAGWQVDAHGAEPAPDCRWIPDCAADRAAPPVPRWVPLLNSDSNCDDSNNHKHPRAASPGTITDDDDDDTM